MRKPGTAPFLKCSAAPFFDYSLDTDPQFYRVPGGFGHLGGALYVFKPTIAPTTPEACRAAEQSWVL